jgi:primosomal protein N' (replication factor Y) (superfamily II helicase)
VPNLFTYRLMREHVGTVQTGARVIVQFGRTKIVTAIVVAVHQTPPQSYQAKYLLEVLDENPYFNSNHIDTLLWIAQYYMCTPGEVLNVALPAGLKISSLSKVQLNPDFDYPELLTDREQQLLAAIEQQKGLTYDEIARLAEVKNPYNIIKSLIAKKAVFVYEELLDHYSPKLIKKVKLTDFYADPTHFKSLLVALERSKKQAQIAVLLKYNSYVPILKNPSLNQKGLEKTTLASNEELSSSALNTLIKNQIFESFQVKVSRFPDLPAQADMPQLSDSQQQAYLEILALFNQKDTVLLHGITGSGKTEVYIQLIQQALHAGSQVLYLLPEIALTTQIVQRLRLVFGDKVGVYHSRFSDNERVEVWQGLAEGRYQFVVGVRSAIFLPFTNLGLIVVDEEHEASYKQFDPAPRYHARDVAQVIARKQGAKVLLGSATPSVESRYQAQQGRYGYVTLSSRYSQVALPNLQLVDLQQATRQQQVQGEYSSQVLEAITATLNANQQVILFQNRRGFAPYLSCNICTYTAVCYQCDVSLTYHYKEGQLRCHYCGHHELKPQLCPACGSASLQTRGFGTEKVEDDMAILYPKARIARVDVDSTRNKGAFQTLINEVDSGAINILVGTQMISKGLDFERVALVCVFDADRLIHYPDYRSRERAYQLISQVAGRAGRRQTIGQVLIQTNMPEHPLLHQIAAQDYQAMYFAEITERERYLYPPFGRLIHITLKHQEQPRCLAAATALAAALASQLGPARVLGPDKPVVDRIRDRFLFEILIKLEKAANMRSVKAFLQDQISHTYTNKDLKNVQIIVDVDFMG